MFDNREKLENLVIFLAPGHGWSFSEKVGGAKLLIDRKLRYAKHRRRNVRPWPPHSSSNFFLKSFPSFLHAIFIRMKTIHQDEEGTNLHINAS